MFDDFLSLGDLARASLVCSFYKNVAYSLMSPHLLQARIKTEKKRACQTLITRDAIPLPNPTDPMACVRMINRLSWGRFLLKHGRDTHCLAVITPHHPVTYTPISSFKKYRSGNHKGSYREIVLDSKEEGGDTLIFRRVFSPKKKQLSWKPVGDDNRVYSLHGGSIAGIVALHTGHAPTFDALGHPTEDGRSVGFTDAFIMSPCPQHPRGSEVLET